MDAVFERGRNANDEIKEAIDNVKLKNAELRQSINYLQKENQCHKLKYNRLKQQLNNLRTVLEKNVNVLNEMFIDTKSALQMCKIPILNSPIVQRQTAPVTRSPQAGPSKAVSPVVLLEKLTKNVTRRRLHIEPINMQELQQMSEIAPAENVREQDEASLREELSTIWEENTKELSVRVSRLPRDVMVQHLQKMNGVISSSSFDMDESFESRLGPTFSSTPHKLEAMRTLGLMPSPSPKNDSVPEFVSVRKKDSGNKINVRSNGLVSPKKEISSPEKPSPKKENVAKKSTKREKKSLMTDSMKKSKREKSPEAKSENGRPTRKAKPKVLKEESLKMKKRRD